MYSIKVTFRLPTFYQGQLSINNQTMKTATLLIRKRDNKETYSFVLILVRALFVMVVCIYDIHMMSL
jgi:hypothetical protein